MPQKDPSKTEEATPKQRKKAREEGNVPKSQELSKIVGLLGGIIALRLTFPYITNSILETINWFFRQAFSVKFTEPGIYNLFIFSTAALLKIVLPVMVFILIFTIGIMYAQIGPLWTLKPLKPKLKVFNVVNGLKQKLLDVKTLVRLV
ncbi:MAG: EscU/YscU/HrcU family type III secretion system export apparatus switch protein, partial [Desulfonatronovibrio sp.]